MNCELFYLICSLEGACAAEIFSQKILPERRSIMLKEIAGTRAYNILKKRKMETVEDVCQLFPSKYYDFSFINPLFSLKYSIAVLE